MAKGKYEYWITEEGSLKIEGWARDGLTDEQIAHNMGINIATLYAWKKKYSEIYKSLKRGKEVVDILVENALLKRALGYKYTETTKERIVDTGQKKRHGGESELTEREWKFAIKLIKGNTYGMAYVTEANECHRKFLKEVFDRTLSSTNRKIFHDLNPKEEEHWYYTEILKFHEEQQANDENYGYNYGHFTLVDNMSMSDEKIRTVLKTYQKGTVWYKRDIKGERAVAEGIIFRKFAENNIPYLCDDSILKYNKDGELFPRPSKVVIGMDFGGNGSMTTMVCSLYFRGYHFIYPVEEDYLKLSPDIDANNICDKYIEFYRRCAAKYERIDWTFPDSASTTMINSLRSAAKKEGLPYDHIAGCRKNEISERPRTVDLLLNTGRMKVHKRCVNLRKAIGTLKWDEKHPNIPEDKNIGNCNDWWDALCYTMLDFIEYIDLDR